MLEEGDVIEWLLIKMTIIGKMIIMILELLKDNNNINDINNIEEC